MFQRGRRTRFLVWVLGGLHIPEKGTTAEVSICEGQNPRKYRWFMDFGESIRRHSIVDEQLTRRLRVDHGGGGVTTYIIDI